jgi:hypothetical protein
MKNLHLIPINVIDIVDKLNAPGIRDMERSNYILRLEAIRDYCDGAITKNNNQKLVKTPRAFK